MDNNTNDIALKSACSSHDRYVQIERHNAMTNQIYRSEHCDKLRFHGPVVFICIVFLTGYVQFVFVCIYVILSTAPQNSGSLCKVGLHYPPSIMKTQTLYEAISKYTFRQIQSKVIKHGPHTTKTFWYMLEMQFYNENMEIPLNCQFLL